MPSIYAVVNSSARVQSSTSNSFVADAPNERESSKRSQAERRIYGAFVLDELIQLYV